MYFRILFCMICLSVLVNQPIVSVSAPVDGDGQYTDYLSALEALPNKKFREILEHELRTYLRRYPDAANRGEIHFELATFYHDNRDENRSFFEHMKFLYLYPGSPVDATARDRVRSILVQEKKYAGIRDQVETLLSREMPSVDHEIAFHAFLRDMYELRFEEIRGLLIRACQDFLDLYPAAPMADEPLFWRAELLAEDKETYKALSEFLKLTYLHTGSLYVTASKLKMAELFTDRLNEHRKAILTLEEFLLEYPDDPQASQAQYQIARIQEKEMDKYLEAINAYTAVAQKYPQSIEAVPALFEAARLYEDRFDEYDQAIRIYTEVVRDFPNDIKAPHAMAEAARIYERELKDYNNAANVYYKVFAHYPESAIATESLYAAAELNEKELGDLQKAIEYYRLVTEKYPDNKLAEKANKRISKISKELTSQ